jgi:nitroreductase
MPQLEESPVFSAIKRRRSARRFDDTPLDDQTILSMLEAARWAPSGCNLQPLVYVVVTDSALKNKVKAVSPGLVGNPATIITVCIDNTVIESAGLSRARPVNCWIEVGMAAQNLMLQAEDLGLASCAIGSFNVRAVRLLLQIPDHVDPGLIISLGYSRQNPEAPSRRPLADITSWDSYGTKRPD